MKRWIGLLLAVLLLCGCTQQPVETAPTQTGTLPTQTSLPEETTQPIPRLLADAEPWVGSADLLKISLPFEPGLAELSFVKLENSVLFWQMLYGEEGPECLMFWLMELETGALLKSYELPLEHYAVPQVQKNRICICNNEAGVVTVLNHNLEEVQHWELEPDWHRWHMGAGDRLYIEMGDHLLERDLATGEERALLEGVTGLYTNAVEADGMNLSYYNMDTGRWGVAVLDFETGEVETAPFRGQFDTMDRWEDLWLCRRFADQRSMRIGHDREAWDVEIPEGSLSLLNDGTLLLNNSNCLSLYSLPGHFLSSCDIGSIVPCYLWEEPVYFAELSGYLMTVCDLESGLPTLLYWPLGTGSGADLETEWVDLSVTEEQELAQLAERAEELGTRFGLEILTGTDCETDFMDHTAQHQTDPEVLREQLDILEQVLVSFPEGFVPQLCHNGYERIQIHLVRDIMGKPHYGTGGSYSGFVTADWEQSIYFMALSTEMANAHTYYHEFSHIIEDYVEWDSIVREDAIYSWEGWMERNPEGFDYTYDRANYIDLAEEWEPYFIDNYALINMDEDRARCFEYACTDYSDWILSQKPGVVEKLRYYAMCIRDAFDTEGWPEVTIWERYLQ